MGSQLDAGRAARQAQAKTLSDRLNSLSMTMYALVRNPAKSRLQKHLLLPASPLSQPRSVPDLHVNPVQKTVQELSVFDAEDGDAGKTRRQRGRGGEGQSQTVEGEGGNDDGGFDEDFQSTRGPTLAPLARS